MNYLQKTFERLDVKQASIMCSSTYITDCEIGWYAVAWDSKAADASLRKDQNSVLREIESSKTMLFVSGLMFSNST